MLESAGDILAAPASELLNACSTLRNEDVTLSNLNCAAAIPRATPGSDQPTELPVQVVQYIVNHLDGDLSDSALAARFSLEQDVLLSKFESHTGIALDQYVLRRRIEYALYLLKHSDSSDSEIAVHIGLRTALAFRTAFFNYLGVSPTDYRKALPLKQQAGSLARRKRPCKSVGLPLKSGEETLRQLRA